MMAVTKLKGRNLDDGAVTEFKIADGAVTTTKILEGDVIFDRLGTAANSGLKDAGSGSISASSLKDVLQADTTPVANTVVETSYGYTVEIPAGS